MTIGVIAAMEQEMRALLSELQHRSTEEIAGTAYHTGTIGGLKAVLAVGGVGKVNAAICTQILIDRFHVGAVINTGIAGSLDDRAGHLSVVIADRITYHDVRREQRMELFPYQEFFESDQELVKRLYEASDKETTRIGGIVTGDAFIADSRKKEELKEAFGALCVEMEGAAVAHAAHVNGVPFCVVRCISDMANDAAETDYKEYESLAATKVAGMVHAMLAWMGGE